MFENRKVLKKVCLVVLLLAAVVISVFNLRKVREEGVDIKLIVPDGWRVEIFVEGEAVDLKAESTLPFTLVNKSDSDHYGQELEEVEGVNLDYGPNRSLIRTDPRVPGSMRDRSYFYGLLTVPGVHKWEVESRSSVHLRIAYNLFGAVRKEPQSPVNISAVVLPTFRAVIQEVLGNLLIFWGTGFFLLKMPEVIALDWKERKFSIQRIFRVLTPIFLLSFVVVIVVTLLQLRTKRFAANEVFLLRPGWRVTVSVIDSDPTEPGINVAFVEVRGSEEYVLTLQESLINDLKCVEAASPPEFHDEFIGDLSSSIVPMEEHLTGENFYGSGYMLCGGEYTWELESSRKVYMVVEPNGRALLEPTNNAILQTFLRNLAYGLVTNITIIISMFLIQRIKVKKLSS